MSTPAIANLRHRQIELSRQVILDAGIELLEQGRVEDLTIRAAARLARVAERTVYRHFSNRDALLDALAEAASERIAAPPPPTTLDDLLSAPRSLYQAFERSQGLVAACTHPELARRIREAVARTRWAAVRRLVELHAPAAPPRARKVAISNICYSLTASSWNYYRFHLGLSLADAIACGEAAVRGAFEQVAKTQ